MKKTATTTAIVAILASPFFIVNAAAVNHTQPHFSLHLSVEAEPALVTTRQLTKVYQRAKKALQVTNVRDGFNRITRAIGSGDATSTDTLLPETSLD